MSALSCGVAREVSGNLIRTLLDYSFTQGKHLSQRDDHAPTRSVPSERCPFGKASGLELRYEFFRTVRTFQKSRGNELEMTTSFHYLQTNTSFESFARDHLSLSDVISFRTQSSTASGSESLEWTRDDCRWSRERKDEGSDLPDCLPSSMWRPTI